ncbi:MAG: hypothetical protein UY72_C0031G0001, partial [Candidatus Uhrbacteria bacterium GW2011_GWD2_52_7]
DMVSTGIGVRTKNEDDYVLRRHNGEVQAFLKRRHALPAERCSVTVSTIEIYCDEWTEYNEEPFPADEFNGVTHVITGVSISGGPMSLRRAPTPRDLVRQLADKIGKRENVELTNSLNRAWESNRFWSEFCEVSD